MKSLTAGFLILLGLSTKAQSPSLVLYLKMDSATTESTRYKIEMNFCEPVKKTERGDWFSRDTSKIDFGKLKTTDITCGGYFSSNEGLIRLSGEKTTEEFNAYEFHGQVFAWEKIFVFKISNQSSRGWQPEMYVVMPVKYKAFFTHIDLTGLVFQSGKVIVLSDLNAKYEKEGSRLTIRQSLKNEKGIDVKGFPLEKLLEKE